MQFIKYFRSGYRSGINIELLIFLKAKNSPERKPFEIYRHGDNTEESLEDFSKYIHQGKEKRVPFIKEKVNECESTFNFLPKILCFSSKILK